MLGAAPPVVAATDYMRLYADQIARNEKQLGAIVRRALALAEEGL